ncbi:helix-turn-helix transcriptional regulator [Streptomyces sp. enrichment culture]|uniref:helix-turn-helix transcriptional regulator n=1 Tax=Streptomyces sp. enrichment culture TaxID=1795815 RepID=UPI003F5615C6
MKTAARTDSAPTLAEIKNWPATVNVTRCAHALGCSPSHLYELIKQGKAPVRMLRLGTGRTVVVTASLVRLLETGDPDPTPPASALVAA